jgi:hypothetical protein
MVAATMTATVTGNRLPAMPPPSTPVTPVTEVGQAWTGHRLCPDSLVPRYKHGPQKRCLSHAGCSEPNQWIGFAETMYQLASRAMRSVSTSTSANGCLAAVVGRA